MVTILYILGVLKHTPSSTYANMFHRNTEAKREDYEVFIQHSSNTLKHLAFASSSEFPRVYVHGKILQTGREMLNCCKSLQS